MSIDDIAVSTGRGILNDDEMRVAGDVTELLFRQLAWMKREIRRKEWMQRWR
jgi:hypothetical protein